MKTILAVIKFSLFRLFPKLFQINPKADNIRAKSYNGYVHHRGSDLPYTGQGPQEPIWQSSTDIVHPGLAVFLISTSPESSNQTDMVKIQSHRLSPSSQGGE